MPAKIVFVHDDPDFTAEVAATLVGAGYPVATYADPLVALDALERPGRVQLLITRIRFPEGRPHGISLAQMASLKRPGVQVLFVGQAECREHADGVGPFMAHPIAMAEFLTMVGFLLEAAPPRPNGRGTA